MIEHLSYSSISAYQTCPANWKYKYIDKRPTASTPELLFGSAFHNAIETLYKEPGQPLDVWTTQWNRQLQLNPNVQWIEDRPEEMFNQGLKMLTHPDIQTGLADIQPLINSQNQPAIETRVEFYVPGVPLPIICYIDIITADGIPGDFKTSSQSWTLDKALAETQPLYYLAALSQIGSLVKDGAFRHYVFVKTKTPKFQKLEHRRRNQELFWLFNMIRRVWRAIELEAFPENPASWKCNPKYCDFWSICRGK